MESVLQIDLSEWQTVGPEQDTRLVKRSLQDDACRQLADQLTKSKRLDITELAQGLRIAATSYVGRVQVGDVVLTIRPKLLGMPLLRLLRYAYGLRQLALYDTSEQATSSLGFQELLALQLMAEVEELLARGLHRDYLRRSDDLETPRGRIDFLRLVRGGESARATLPCVHYPRVEDTHLNRLVLAGVVFAATLLGDPELRGKAHRLEKQMAKSVKILPLSRMSLVMAGKEMDRRTRAYEPATTLIEILLNMEGVSLDEGIDPVTVKGFLFDMNRFFQALLSRFLRDNLVGIELHDERSIRQMFSYEPDKNPQHRRAPKLRPDFTVMAERQVLAVLDAKYRDLWELSLPREMLYQLALYALAREESCREAVILYPTLKDAAKEQVVGIERFSASFQLKPRVTMRPVNLLRLDRLVSGSAQDIELAKQRRSWATHLAFGSSSS
jgi:5-methylcytosine-specific restriction enzyme subunit McrC